MLKPQCGVHTISRYMFYSIHELYTGIECIECINKNILHFARPAGLLAFLSVVCFPQVRRIFLHRSHLLWPLCPAGVSAPLALFSVLLVHYYCQIGASVFQQYTTVYSRVFCSYSSFLAVLERQACSTSVFFQLLGSFRVQPRAVLMTLEIPPWKNV